MALGIFLSCSKDDDTTNITAENASAAITAKIQNCFIVL